MKVYYQKDIQKEVLKNQIIGILGYGSQGHAHALNLKDSNYQVIIGLPSNSKSREKALNDGFTVLEPNELASKVDVLMVLVPDEIQANLYHLAIEPNLKPGATLLFAHGFNIHYQFIVPRPDLNVGMIAPKSPGHKVREFYVQNQGVPSLVAVYQDPSNQTLDLILEYGNAIGSGKAGMIQTTFKDETETDLFGEQAVLCGGLVKLMEAGFETLTAAGYPDELAYFECVHEMKLIVDLIYAKGVKGMRESISNTAEFGDYHAGPQIITNQTKVAMQELLANIQNKKFANQFMDQAQSGHPLILAERAKTDDHPMNKIGYQLRKMMSFLESEENNESSNN